jgi:hypothetical protein
MKRRAEAIPLLEGLRMKSIDRSGLVLFILAAGLAACGDKDKANPDAVPSGPATEVASDMPSEPPPPPPPPPRVVDCTPAQQEAAAPALDRFGRDFRNKAMALTAPLSSTVKTCQYDTQTARIMALGEYRFKGKINNDELGFTVNFDTDANGGNPQFSNFLPEEKLEKIVTQRRQVIDFLKTVKKPEDLAGAVPQPQPS